MWYLCYFLHRLLDYRLPEVESLARMFSGLEDLEVKWKQSPDQHPDSPFYYVWLPSDDVATKIACRSVLVKGIFEIWGEGKTYEELKTSIERYPEERKAPYLSEDKTFKIIVDSFGKVLTFEEQTERIQSFTYVHWKGQVDLKNPQHKFWVIETHGFGVNNGLPPAENESIIFGREIGVADRKSVVKYELSRRKYLGPTAMDAEMALLMANQALAMPGKLVYDPFVGTGSILIGAAHCGAMTMGADIDIRVIRDGKGPDRNVWSNFKQVFDAIICDPPYGIRAGGRKSGGRRLLKGTKDPYTISKEKRHDHIPSTAPYTLEECVHDLFDMAARLLVPHGRLVFFYPAARGDYSDEHLPKHQCFSLIANSEQILSTRYSRRLLTMEKTGKYTDEDAARAKDNHNDFRVHHAEIVERDRESRLHNLVFSPADVGGEAEGIGSLQLCDVRPRYRGKYV